MSPHNLHDFIQFLFNPWVLLGFFGQFLFFMRFIVQWLASEKKGAIVVPKAFWYLSIGGTLIILVYSIHIRDIVFTVAQILSLFIYARNLMFERKLKLERERQFETAKSETNEPV
jgi:lipid-A-disaccharide synthase-like uncharacterized protein